MRVLEGEKVDLYADGDVGGLEGWQLEGHAFYRGGSDVFVDV